MRTTRCLLGLVALAATISLITGKQRVVCYFTNWAWYRVEPGKLFPEDVDTSLCTHINYAFALLDPQTLLLISSDTWADIDKDFFQRIYKLKEKNPDLKNLLSLGGWVDSKESKYSRLVRDPASRKKFIDHVITFLKQHKFDGLDIDWEYPKCWQGECHVGPDEDKANFAAWVKELRQAFDAQSPKLLLTAAVIGGGDIIDKGYDVPSLARDLDFINIMTYDFHSNADGKTGHHAQFKKRNVDSYDAATVVDSAKQWLQKGVPKDKLVIGVPAYGRSYKLANPEQNGLGAPTAGPGNAGEITKEGGMLGFYEVCTRIKNNGWRKQNDPSVGSWASSGDQWVGYDDLDDVVRKAQWIWSEGLGGIMIWDLSTDDIKRKCCSTNFPFMRALNYGLTGKGKSPSTYGCP